MLKRKELRGFSLVEVLIAMALLAIIVLSVSGLVVHSMRRAYGGKKMTEATVLAQAVMERVNQPTASSLLAAEPSPGDSLRRKTWTRSGSTVTPADETGQTLRNSLRSLFEQANLPGGNTTATQSQLTVEVQAVPAGRTFANALMNRVVVEVRWTEYGNRVRRVQLESLNLP